MTTRSADMYDLEIGELAELIRTRAISSVEATRAQLDRIAAIGPALHSYAHVTPEIAMMEAEAADAEIATGRYRGPLHGVPIGIKDLCWTKNVPTAAGMTIHRDFRPDTDATVVRRLRDAGAVMLGKLQLTEGAYSDHHPEIAAPVNPWSADHWPGISSSGSGTAIAAGLCYGALASDTGGSIRWPAAANGVTGIKPSWGRVSRFGVFELAASLDHVGTMARSAVDAGILLQAIAGADPKDPTASLEPVPDYRKEAAKGLDNIRIGIDPIWNEKDVDDATRTMLAAAAANFRSMGARLVDVTLPDPTGMIADWAPNCAVEAAVAHDSTYPSRKADYGPVLASVLDAGHAVSATEYQRILLRRMAYRGEMNRAFNKVDLLLMPVQGVTTPHLDAIATLGTQPDLVAQLQRYTCPFDMTGHPTITLPGGATEQGLPIGLQLVAAHSCEALLIRAGANFQRATDWHRRRPKI